MNRSPARPLPLLLATASHVGTPDEILADQDLLLRTNVIHGRAIAAQRRRSNVGRSHPAHVAAAS
jgi:hypothetical protein